MTQRISVVYIVGSGRSGSTILDTVLGNQEQIESVGELINGPRAWMNELEYCACGELAGECPFWSAVREAWHHLHARNLALNDWRAIQSRFERPRYLFSVYRHAQRETTAFKEYAEGVKKLYQAIAKVSGKPVVVDSSKNPVRALAMSYVKGIDLKLIHLIRDGRGVAWSLKKPYQKDPEKGVQKDLPARPIWRTAMSWSINNLLAERAVSRLDSASTLQLRYEDFVSRPSEALDRVGYLTGLDFNKVNRALENGEEFQVGHTIAGNRVRMGERIQLRADTEWLKVLPKRDRAIFWTIAGKIASRYGYSRGI